MFAILERIFFKQKSDTNTKDGSQRNHTTGSVRAVMRFLWISPGPWELNRTSWFVPKLSFLAVHCNPIHLYLWKRHESWTALKLPFWPGVRNMCRPNRLFHLKRLFHQYGIRTKEWSINRCFLRCYGRIKTKEWKNMPKQQCRGCTPDLDESPLWLWR